MRTRGTIQSITKFVAVTIGLFIGGHASAQGHGGYESDQGTRIFGTLDPRLEGVRIPYAPQLSRLSQSYASITVDAGQLKIDRGIAVKAMAPDKTFALAGARTVGTAIDPQASVSLTIQNAQRHKNYYTGAVSTVWEYQVIVGTPTGAKPLCFAEHNWALAVPGNWSGFQLVTKDDPTGFTFACLPVHDQAVATARSQPLTARQLTRFVIAQPRWHGGASAKCIDRGYAPWASGVPTLGMSAKGYALPAATDPNARRMHNVCVQAMTADYAGNSQSHTLPGTVIALLDLTNVPSIQHAMLVKSTGAPGTISSDPPRIVEFLAPEFDDLLFEGVWTEDEHRNAHVGCLARARWQTIDPADRQGPPCDERAIEDLIKPTIVAGKRQIDKPYLFSYSPISEKGLWRIRIPNENGYGWLTTSHVSFTPSGPLGPAGPFSEGDETFEGNVVSPDALYLTLDQVQPLYLYRKGASFLTTRDSTIPDGYQAMYWSDDLLKVDSHAALKTPLHAAPPDRNSSGHTPVPEGYTFNQRPSFPDLNPALYTGTQALSLSLRGGNQRYCTTAQPDACKDYAPARFQGFLLAPSGKQRPPYHPPLQVDGPQVIPLIDPPDDHEIRRGRIQDSPPIRSQAPTLEHQTLPSKPGIATPTAGHH